MLISLHVPCRNPLCFASYTWTQTRCHVCGVPRGSTERRPLPAGPDPYYARLNEKEWQREMQR